MDRLKDFIENNKDAFDDELLPDGHYERFEKKLPHRDNRATVKYRLYTLTAVAAAALLLLFIIPGNLTDIEGEKANAFQCETWQEIEELKTYYQMQINGILTQMEDLNESKQIPGSEYIMNETARLVSMNEQFETHIAPSIPCSEEGLFAINQHYSNSLESLERMRDLMEHSIQE